MTVAASSPGLRGLAIPLDGDSRDYDALLEQLNGQHFVLLGEASHGTEEFYRMRAEITRRLIEEKGFDAVAAEADWPDAWRLNRFVQGLGEDDSRSAFDDFERFPEWMWRNHEVLEFITWLRQFNTGQTPARPVGFYGLDLYSLYRSAEAVVRYLQRVDPEQAEIARRSYACLDHVRNPQRYGYESAFHLRPPCKELVLQQLVELIRNSQNYLSSGGLTSADEQFFAERNAAVVRNAETYYRAMFGSRINTWNLRDQHMAETLFALQAHLQAQGREGRIVVWAHNSHLGDARQTEMGQRGEFNLGQLVRQTRGPEDALLVGFTTYTGHVSAAHNWDDHVWRMAVRPALPESYEHLFYRSGLERFFVSLRDPAAAVLEQPLLERAIGVIYRPQSERASHYFQASLGRQFDAVFHLDETEAVEPLYSAHHWSREEQEQDLPETYPFGV